METDSPADGETLVSANVTSQALLPATKSGAPEQARLRKHEAIWAILILLPWCSYQNSSIHFLKNKNQKQHTIIRIIDQIIIEVSIILDHNWEFHKIYVDYTLLPWTLTYMLLPLYWSPAHYSFSTEVLNVTPALLKPCTLLLLY